MELVCYPVKVLFLAYQTGALQILEGFASTRSFFNKIKSKNTENGTSSAHAQVQICVFLKNLRFLARILNALSVIGGKESDSAAISIYINNLHRITGLGL